MGVVRSLLPSILVLAVAILSGPALAQRKAAAEPLRGYCVMAGGLGRAPRSETEMWPNTVKAHLEFIERARINLVVIETPYGIGKRHPKSPAVARFIRKLRERKVAVWLIYPHVLAQTFDLPRQVGRDGERVEWNCCFNDPKVQDWLVENGVGLVEAYEPDALVLFGTFHVGSACHCAKCKAAKSKDTEIQERFFRRLDAAVAKVDEDVQIGTCDFWTRPTKATQQAVDLLCPVASIFRPGYADARRVTEEIRALPKANKKARVVPYIKVFLASQTKSETADLLGAVREATERGDGFFLWGYNPGHSYRGQDYDHEVIARELAALAPKKKR